MFLCKFLKFLHNNFAIELLWFPISTFLLICTQLYLGHAEKKITVRLKFELLK